MDLAPRSKMVSTMPARSVQRRFLEPPPGRGAVVWGRGEKGQWRPRDPCNFFCTGKPTEHGRRWQNLELHFSYRQSLTNGRAVCLQIRQRRFFFLRRPFPITTPSPSLSPFTPFNVLIFLPIGQHPPSLDRHTLARSPDLRARRRVLFSTCFSDVSSHPLPCPPLGDAIPKCCRSPCPLHDQYPPADHCDHGGGNPSGTSPASSAILPQPSTTAHPSTTRRSRPSPMAHRKKMAPASAPSTNFSRSNPRAP